MSLGYSQISSADVPQVGPKAVKLAQLARLTSIPVNPGVVLTWPQVEPLVTKMGLASLVHAARSAAKYTAGRARLDARVKDAHGHIERIGLRVGIGDLAWREALGLELDSLVVVRSSPVYVPEPFKELDGIGSSRVCTVAEVPAVTHQIVMSLLDADQLIQLASVGPGDVRLAFLINPFPEHQVAGICASFDVRSGSTDLFELHIGHGQLYGITRGYTVPDSYVIDFGTGVVEAFEPGNAREAVYLDADRQYHVRPLPEGYANESVAASASLDLPALVHDFRGWLLDARNVTGRARLNLEFCIETAGAVVVTDIRLY